MAPSPTDTVKVKRVRSPLTTVALWLLILLGVALVLYFMLDDPDPDRPPIIVSSGSVIVTGAEWTDEGGNRFKEKIKGRSVKSFSATTGSCTVAGTKLTVTFGATNVTLEPKKKGLFGKRDAEIEFPSNVVVNSSTPTMLMVVTNDALMSVSNDSGTRCAVVGQRIEIQQVH